MKNYTAILGSSDYPSEDSVKTNYHDVKMPVKKDSFVKLMKFIENQWNLEDSASDELTKTYGYCDFYPSTKWSEQILSFLEETTNDSYGLIEKFIYELNFGNDYFDGVCVDKEGNEINLSNAGELYEALLNHYKK